MFQVGDPFGKDHRVDEARYSGNSRLSSPELGKNYECLILPIKEPEAKKNANNLQSDLLEKLPQSVDHMYLPI